VPAKTFETDVLQSTREFLTQGTRTGKLAQEFGKRNAVPGELVVRLRPVKVISAFG
jgi:hypothetical protein